jgi:SNF2 family DNA or RNA helicase
MSEKHIFIEAERWLLEMLRGSVNIRMDRARPGRASCWRSPHNLMRIRRIFPQSKYRPSCSPILERMRREYGSFARLAGDGRRALGGELPVDHQWKVKPFLHQEMLLSFAVTMGHSAIFADCGAGKTAVGVNLIEWFKRANGGVRALVVCPLSIINKAWGDDIEKFSGLSWASLWFPSKAPSAQQRRDGLTGKDVSLLQRVDSLSDPGIDVWVANYETIRRDDFISHLKNMEFDIVIADEASRIKDKNTKSFKNLMRISETAKHRLVLTGTPAPNGVLDLWSQFMFVDRGETLDPHYTDFRQDVASSYNIGPGRPPTWRAKPGAADRVAPMVAMRSVSIKLEDCVDLPPVTTIERPVVLPAENARAYQQMKLQLFAEIEGQTLSVTNQLSKLTKLRQITGGFVYDTAGNSVIPMKKNPKLDELALVLEEIGDRDVIVWAEYRAEIEAILERFKSRNPISLYGGTGGQDKKDEAFDKFRDDPTCSLCVAHPQSASVGLTMTWAQYSISYSISYRYDDDYQKNRRIYRPGQTRPVVFMYLICPGTIDSTMMACIRRKESLSDRLTPGSFDAAVFQQQG